MPYSFMGIIALGMGFYGLVPAITLGIHTVTLFIIYQKKRKYFLSFGLGFSTILVSLLLFIVGLNLESKKITQNTTTKSFDSNEDLPNYITISQNLEANFWNEILLKKDIVYTSQDNFFEFRSFNSIGSSQFNERKIHNPFITIAYLFCNDLNLSADDRINILKSNFDKRLETEEQLWSGEDLFTKISKKI